MDTLLCLQEGVLHFQSYPFLKQLLIAIKQDMTHSQFKHQCFMLLSSQIGVQKPIIHFKYIEFFPSISVKFNGLAQPLNRSILEIYCKLIEDCFAQWSLDCC